jgi:hypothetical protein
MLATLALAVALGAALAGENRTERVYADRAATRQQMLGLVWRSVVLTLQDLEARIEASTFDATRLLLVGGGGLGTGVTEDESLSATLADLESLGDVTLDLTVRPDLHGTDASLSGREREAAVRLRLDVETSVDLESRASERELKRFEKLFFRTLERYVERYLDEIRSGVEVPPWVTPPHPGEVATPPIYGPPRPTPPWDGG